MPSSPQPPDAIYTRAFPQEYGHAFWILEPNQLLRDYSVQGVQIGDVLVWTSGGGYDYLFNICRPKDDPVNAGRTYDGFEHLPLDPAFDILDTANWLSAGSSLGSSSGKMFSASADASVRRLSVPVCPGLAFRTSRSSGALLILPDGASQTELRNHKRFNDWIKRNIHAVFAHVNGDQFGREATSIFVVTSCVKCIQSVVGAFTNASDLHETRFSLNVSGDGVNLSYSASIQCPPSTRVTPITLRHDGIRCKNHCAFARGLTCTKRQGSKRSKIKVGDISTHQSWDVEDQNGGSRSRSLLSFASSLMSYGQPSGSLPSFSTPPALSCEDGSNPCPEQGDSDDERDLQHQSDDDGEIHLSFARYSRRDPWAEMNERFLRLHPDYDYVISHTNDLPQAPEQIPPLNDDHDVSLAVDETHPEHSRNRALASPVIDAPSEDIRMDVDPSLQALQPDPVLVAQSLGGQMPVASISYSRGDFEPHKDLATNLTVPNGSPVIYGGFSDIYRGHLRTEKGDRIEVAVKILRGEGPQDSERLRKRLSHEAKIFIAAQHPLIVEFYGIAAVGSRPALVLKWYDNGNASQYLAERTTREKLTVIKDIAGALEHLHGQDIVHGELKGANVLITDTGNAVLTDFGLSHFIDKQTNETTSSDACSIRWLSPELAALYLGVNGVSLTVRNRTRESDVWAFGSTAFELLSRTVPYAKIQNHVIIAQKIVDGTSPLEASPNTVLEPSAVTPILQQCWRVQPAGRPTMSDVVGLLSLL